MSTPPSKIGFAHDNKGELVQYELQHIIDPKRGMNGWGITAKYTDGASQYIFLDEEFLLMIAQGIGSGVIKDMFKHIPPEEDEQNPENPYISTIKKICFHIRQRKWRRALASLGFLFNPK